MGLMEAAHPPPFDKVYNSFNITKKTNQNKKKPHGGKKGSPIQRDSFAHSLHQRGCQALEQAAQGSGWVTIPGGV